MLSDLVNQFIDARQQTGLWRERRLLPHADKVLNFSSNDYLSLSSDTRVRAAYQEGFAQFPAGSTGSMVVSGYYPIHQTLENTFAEALEVDTCLLFTSGYAANLSVMSLFKALSLPVVMDKASHASLYDGLALANHKFIRFKHQDIRDFSKKTHSMPSPGVVITEGINSMSGQIAPLAEMAVEARAKGCVLFVDEAHSFGVMGPEGLGAVPAFKLSAQDVPLRVIPFGKALAATGAIVAGQQRWIDALQQVARPHIYSTALSPAIAHGVLKTLDFLQAANDRRQILSNLVAYIREKIKDSRHLWRESQTPVQQLQVGCSEKAMRLSQHLSSHGILCLPMRPPTVSQPETGLRVILNAHHQFTEIDYLFDCLELG